MPSSLYVLLDANVIIEAHVCNVWASMISRIALVVPSTVLEEAQFYIDPQTQQMAPIHLDAAIQAGSVRIVSATAEQLAQLTMRFDSVFVQRMDRGEAEALALLLAGELPDHRFCTADGPAIRALSLLDMLDAGISFEALLRQAGLTHSLRPHFSERFYHAMLTQGARERILGQGLRKPQEPPHEPPQAGKGSKRNRKPT